MAMYKLMAGLDKWQMVGNSKRSPQVAMDLSVEGTKLIFPKKMKNGFSSPGRELLVPRDEYS